MSSSSTTTASDRHAAQTLTQPHLSVSLNWHSTNAWAPVPRAEGIIWGRWVGDDLPWVTERCSYCRKCSVAPSFCFRWG